MTSKKKLRKRIAYLEQELEITQGILRTIRRRWVNGVKPSPIEALLADEDVSTPVLNTLPRAENGKATTRLTWGWTNMAPPEETIVEGSENKVHDGWLLTPRSEEAEKMIERIRKGEEIRRSMEGSTE